MIDFKEKYTHTNNLIPDCYDKNAYKLSDLIPMKAMKIPKRYESPRAPFVYDQGDSSQCASCAYNYIRYLQEADVENGGSGINTKFAPSFNYANRPEGEDFEGMYIKTVCSKGREGSIPWGAFPGFYSYAKCKQEFYKNKDRWLEMAEPFAISYYYQCSSREQVQQAIIETKGVIVGINVLDCIYDVGPDGIVHYDPKKDIKGYGGHALCITGYFTTDNDDLWWIVQNSWGEEYGDGGRIYLPERFPWLSVPYAIVDYNIYNKWSDYSLKYNIE